ncbi:glycosyltransferase [Leptospira sp. 201903070]|uniref:Glycosyltransferase n=1 Tax=Leptospira ainlahdjerensis TaxID=2810033 RepID=A0ABS2UA77_9LEPT|nr:glycosyltransferase [Leptospira ainlahdjerensis]MBM9577281.1 glycosyltransferase [Leptospira ainlahdjerensis]
MNSLSPIALFVYNRPLHTEATISALIKNEFADQSEIFIFCDGARSEKDFDKVSEVRKIVKNIKDGFKKVTVLEKEKNFGLANSVISGVTELTRKYGKVIVLEDDMVTSPYFLRYLNQALNYYEHEERVISIHGYRLPYRGNVPETYFLRGTDCWGWATWKRGWDLFEPNGAKLLARLESENLTYKFDMDGSFPYSQMLRDQISGRNDSWAIRWHASGFLLNKLTLFPARSLVQNIGLDASGTHCEVSDDYNVTLSLIPIKVGHIEIKENKLAKKLYRNHFRRLNYLNFKKRIITSVSNWLRSIIRCFYRLH